MSRPIVAIVGGSGAGKSYLANELLRRFGCSDTLIVSLDNFYKDLSHIPLYEREKINFDEPSAIDWIEFETVLNRLINSENESVSMPIYDFATHTRKKERMRVKPGNIIIAEGLWLLHKEDLRRLFAYSIYVDCSDELRLQRRIERDVNQRGRSRESVIRQFNETVAPMHIKYVQPQKQFANLIVKSPFTNRELDRIEELIRSGI